MGFDNECIVNIQLLAGEYFCPVCRLLVYPDEALQSQCTHLYCKPCLTYVVSTTRACPYDGYLVTEADSKLLMESNKTLAETIAKIPVHCLYHRSGCTWQGTLSDCKSHCSGCAFGNSPVVCNRCGIQIVHRQVQEHAQSCPGVQGQVQQGTITQDPSATTAIVSTASADQNQTPAPAGATASQALNSQTAVTTTTTGQVSNQLTNPASQSQPVQTAVQPTAEQWYQQQQYQQYYQQYPGQDPYQQQYQHYYPYHQSVVPPYQQAYGQPQPQSQSQPQVQPQSQGQPQAQHQAQPQLQPQPQAQGLSQALPQVHAPVAPQSQVQMQVHHQQQQLQPAQQPHSQIQPPSHPLGQTQALSKSQPQPQPQPLPYPYPQVPNAVQSQPQQQLQMPSYQQSHPQMQHSQPQIQQPVQKYPVPQPQVHPQLQPNAPVQHPSQPQVHPHQPLAANVQPQVQNASSHAVTGYHSYPQPQPHQGVQPGAPQHAMQMHAQSGPLPQAQHPVPMQNQFTQKIHQSSTTFPNQPQPALFPPPVQGQSTLPMLQQPVYNPNQQPGQINQRPILQSAQQILPQQPSAQHQMPLQSHLRPQGPAHSFPRHAFPPSQGSPAVLNSTQHSQSQNAGGRPIIPNHAAQMQPFAQSGSSIPVRPGQTGVRHLPENQNLLVGTNNQVQVSSGFQSRPPEQIERQCDVIEQQTDSASGKHEHKSEKVEKDIKPTEVGNKQSGEDPNLVKTSGPNAKALNNGDSASKSVGKGEVAESTREASNGNKSCDTITTVQTNSNEHSALEGSEIKDGSLLKMEAKNVSDSETDKLHNDNTPTTRHPGADNQAPAASQTHGSQGPVGSAQPSHLAPLTDHGKHHQPMTNHGPGGAQQRSSTMLASQLPHPAGPNDPLSAGHSSTVARNQGPAHDPYLGQPHGSDIHFGAPGKSFPPQSLGPTGPYNQGQEPAFHAGASNLSRIRGPQFGAPPPGDMHGGMATNLPPHGPDGFGLQDERFNPFQVPGQQNFGRREFEGDLKKLPRPLLDTEPTSKFGNYPLGPHEAGKRPVGFNEDDIKKSGATLHPGYLGVGPGYGRHHVDGGMAPRSPGSEYVEMPPHRLGPLTGGLASKAGMDDFEGRAAHRFGESAFHGRRFPHPPGHLHREEFEGFASFRMGEHPRSGDFIGQDEFSDHFHRGEHFGPHNFSRRLPLREPIGFGAHPGHMRAVELGGSRSFDSFESFSKGDRPGHPQLGEPGFRSSFSLPGFPNDHGFLPGDIRSFDNLRRRKVTSMGWCRICKVDCETVEGLDLHSQTREHQKMAMDMVKSIKQTVKKQKLIRAEHSSVEDGSKSRKTGFEGRGNKH